MANQTQESGRPQFKHCIKLSNNTVKGTLQSSVLPLHSKGARIPPRGACQGIE